MMEPGLMEPINQGYSPSIGGSSVLVGLFVVGSNLLTFLLTTWLTKRRDDQSHATTIISAMQKQLREERESHSAEVNQLHKDYGERITRLETRLEQIDQDRIRLQEENTNLRIQLATGRKTQQTTQQL